MNISHNPYALIQWATNLAIKHGPKSVLIALITFADNKTGYCFPTIKQISVRSSLKERAVQNALRDLVEEGLITRTIKSGKVTQYTVLFYTELNESTPVNNNVNPRIKQHNTSANNAPKLTNITNQKTIPPYNPPIIPEKLKHGSRLPDDWQPTEQLAAYAIERGLNPERQAEDFRDYWHSTTGKNAVKCDWAAAFRIWCRKAVDFQHKWQHRYDRKIVPLRHLSPAELGRQASLDRLEKKYGR